MNRRTKNYIKKITPEFALLGYKRWRQKQLTKQFSGLDSVSSFDKIYRDRLWVPDGSDVLSGEGTTGIWADSSITDIDRILDGRTDLSVCDVGCGDFVFGQRIADQFSYYHAVDVSKFIIEHNIEKYSHLGNVEFLHINGADVKLPRADIYLIREVLQHITNAHIEKIVSNVIDMGPKLVIVFECVPIADYVPNLDLPTDVHYTRLIVGSGVDLRAQPFGFPFQVFSETPHLNDKFSKLVCYVYRAAFRY